MTVYFGEKLKELRKTKNLTQEKLSEYLGVSFQTVSKWERGDTYPDITTLPEIAAFFKVSVDELLGINKAENEEKILRKLNEYDTLADLDLMWDIIKKLKYEFPSDFRVLLRYMACLERREDDKLSVYPEVLSIYNNIQDNCTDDTIRIASKRAVIELFHSLSKQENSPVSFDDCEKIINQLPRLRDSREMFSFFFPESHPERENNIRKALEELLLLTNTVFAHIFFYDNNYSNEWKTEAFGKLTDFCEFLYDDGNYGKMWQQVIYNYGHLGVHYFYIGDEENALKHLQICAELAVKFDSLERITVMDSRIFKGKEFDKFTLGSTFSAKKRIKHLLTNKYPLSENFKNSNKFKEILSILE